MLPYFEPPDWKLGPLPIHGFGILVAIGCLLGARLVEKRAAKVGLEMRTTASLITWVLIGGFAGAHWFELIAYTPEKIADDPIILLKFWNGISSYGGFMGALVAMFIYMRGRGTKTGILPYADALALGLSVGWVFGRAGCTVAHDHIGRVTSFFLAFRYPEDNPQNIPEGVRHNLGFYEFLYAIALASFLHWYARKPRPSGVIVGILAVAYAPVRYFLDRLRATDIDHADARYLGLTPAMWLSIVTLAVGLAIIRYALKKNQVLEFVPET
jgi:phosphatidylglycerol:prolipoprotein diacylglycerol transferase